MPGLNQTGPMGQGSMTGRRMGRCTNFGAGRKNQTAPENENSGNPNPEQFPEQGFGRGFGRGMGKGMGRNGGGRGMGMGHQNRFRGGM